MPKPQYGRTHQRRREAWADELVRLGSIQCGCTGTCGHHTGRCTTTIRPADTWHLGHGLAHTHGGDGTDSTPWCVACNSADGGRHAHRHAQHPASTDWW